MRKKKEKKKNAIKDISQKSIIPRAGISIGIEGIIARASSAF